MVRTRKNLHTVNSSNNDDSSNKTLTKSNINNQQIDTTSNINTNESQPSNILRTSTLDDQVMITNSLETLSPKSNVKKQPENKNTTTIPTESIERTDTLSSEMDQLTAQEKNHPSDTNAKNNNRIKIQPQFQLNILHNLLKNSQLLWIQMQKNNKKIKIHP
jgi:hypothetical protein